MFVVRTPDGRTRTRMASCTDTNGHDVLKCSVMPMDGALFTSAGSVAGTQNCFRGLSPGIRGTAGTAKADDLDVDHCESGSDSSLKGPFCS